MTFRYDGQASKKITVEVAINADLLQQAESLEIDLSQTFEKHLVDVVKNVQRKRWLEQNKGALDSHGAFIDHHGVFSDGLRRF